MHLFIVILLFVLGSTLIYALPNLIRVINNEENIGNPLFHRTFEFIAIVGTPIFFLSLFDYGMPNECCTDSAFFSPAHRLTIYTIIFLCVAAYYYSSVRTKIAAPLLELIINSVLMVGLVLAIVITIQTNDPILWLPGTPAVALFFISQMIRNHQMLMREMALEEYPEDSVTRFCLKILRSNVFVKVPVLLIISVPVILLLSLILYVFGQRPDSAIRAFTDTYKHGFSQWDYQCENVNCGGHYLCSVAANGHTRVVKPVRIGKRNGHFIICNRQLLVSNAFEELLQERFPFMHRKIRKQYDKVGDMIHRNYCVYSKKWVSDLVYLLMKPAEWFFLLVLYLADRKPEQRIARQYAPWN